MSEELGLLEALVGAALVAGAVVVLWAPRLAAAVAFLVFGIVLAGTWAVMGAPDLAVAEAALGAGVTGALFIEAVSRDGADTTEQQVPVRRWPPFVAGALLTAAVVPALVAVAATGTAGLTDAVERAVPETGVEHPVTAVLLAFRAYDTLLEIAVLFVAVVLVGALRPPGRPRVARPVVLVPFVRRLMPVLVVVAGWLLFAGSSLPGGAFQAGAVLGAALVLARLVGLVPASGPVLGVGGTVGLLAFLALAAAGLALGGWLVLPTGAAGWLIVALETVLAVSIGVSLALFVEAVGEAHPARAEVSR